MRGINKAIVLGTVGADPDTRTISSGAASNISVATSETWKDKNTGERMERTEWHRVVFYGRLAEIVDEYVHKGMPIYIEGKLKTRSWEQDGVKKYSTEIIADEMQMVGKRETANEKPKSTPKPAKKIEIDPDELPFE